MWPNRSSNERRTGWHLPSRNILGKFLLPITLTLLFGAAETALAQQGIITGQVTDAETGEPLAGAQMVLVGTNRGGLADQQGRYRIENVPPGQIRIRANLIGYAAETETLTLTAGETAVADFALSTTAVNLDEVVVTVTGEQQQRELVSSVSMVNAEQVVEEAPITDMSDLLQGRIAGASILQSSGSVGTGTTIRIRGSNSLSLDNQPVIYIDGVRVNTEPRSFSIYAGGQEPSRINDINPQNIKSIQVFKGPAAATLYGTDAANGVLVIETKDGGTGGETRYNFHVEAGLIEDRTTYPDNFRGESAEGDLCLLYFQALDFCTRDRLFASTPLESEVFSPFSTGSRTQYGLDIAGGSADLSYYFSANREREIGVYELSDTARALALAEQGDLFPWQEHSNELERINLRANVRAQVHPDLQLSVNSGYTTSEVQLPKNDNNILGFIFSGMLGSGNPDANGGYGFFRPDDISTILQQQQINRFIISTTGNYQPQALDWLTARGTVGLDLVNREDIEFGPPGGIGFSNLGEGYREDNAFEDYNYTVDLGATARFNLTEDVTSRTSVGTQYIREYSHAIFASGETLPPGVRSIAAAAVTTASEATGEEITLGTYVDQQFGYQDRLFLNLGFRADDNSAFGQDFDVIVYPKAGVSWVAVDQQSEPLFNALNSLRLRASYGESGLAPGTLDAVTFLGGQAVAFGGQEQVGIAIGDAFGALGNAALEPETSREVEAGFDAGFLDGRLGLEATVYYKETEDALVNVPLAPSLGVSTNRFDNLAAVKNSGFEALLNATVLDGPSLRWTVNLNGYYNDNEILELGEDVDPIQFFGPQEHRNGYAPGSYFGRRLDFNDENGDRIIQPSEIELADTSVFLGSAMPTHSLSFSSNIDLLDRVRISGLFDYQGGFSLWNFTELFRCFQAVCEGLNDPNAPLAEQARSVAGFVRGYDAEGAFVEEADFLKFRELSITLFAPDSWAQAVGAERLNLILSGRNLGTWTDYGGLDPEISYFGAANFFRSEFFTQPPVTYFLARIDLSF